MGAGRVQLVQGDIVKASTEAIVNAANAALAGGGGVDGAIHRAAGPELYELTRPLGGCPTGKAVITGAGRIPPPVRFIVHAVGPRYSASRDAECAALLRSAHEESLRRCEEHAIQSVSFPAISTGVYGYPIHKAAPIALGEAIDHLAGAMRSVKHIVFVLFSPADLDAFSAALAAFAPSPASR
ncbi:putative ADP-ribose binding module protein [Chondromyces apiculatus DSM 436]|uniref:Putative ADP-ribose binding module protein n=1 Tax=Chondromyces apiculatus DSM 436 TaxID=1192034 RepID=A0A017SWV0_9BACT|nr:putative ADP-ribose binding module protein [Chondromyces apiculatus DSM 436]